MAKKESKNLVTDLIGASVRMMFGLREEREVERMKTSGCAEPGQVYERIGQTGTIRAAFLDSTGMVLVIAFPDGGLQEARLGWVKLIQEDEEEDPRITCYECGGIFFRSEGEDEQMEGVDLTAGCPACGTRNPIPH
jgi:hypothetical protein